MPSLFDFWREKDRVDQTLHGGIGFVVSLLPTLLLVIFMEETSKHFFFVAIVSYLTILLIAALREKRQHWGKWVFNLDSVFWLIGADVGVIAALGIIILTLEV